MEIWTVVVRPNGQALGDPYTINLESSQSIKDFKEAVKKKYEHTLPLDPQIEVRKAKSEMVLDLREGWKEALKNIEGEKVSPRRMVADLELSYNEFLLAKITGPPVVNC
jgi:hypothetical protein